MVKAMRGPSEFHRPLLVFQGPGLMYLLKPPLIGPGHYSQIENNEN